MSAATNNIMTLSKRAVILETLDDLPVTETNLFWAIGKCNEDVDAKFKKLPNYVTFAAQDPTVMGFRNSGQQHREAYCIRDTLSIKYVGTQVAVLNFKEGLPEMLPDAEMDKIMARLAAITNYEAVDTSDSPALRKAQVFLNESETVNEVRRQAYKNARWQKELK